VADAKERPYKTTLCVTIYFRVGNKSLIDTPPAITRFLHDWDIYHHCWCLVVAHHDRLRASGDEIADFEKRYPMTASSHPTPPAPRGAFLNIYRKGQLHGCHVHVDSSSAEPKRTIAVVCICVCVSLHVCVFVRMCVCVTVCGIHRHVGGRSSDLLSRVTAGRSR